MNRKFLHLIIVIVLIIAISIGIFISTNKRNNENTNNINISNENATIQESNNKENILNSSDVFMAFENQEFSSDLKRFLKQQIDKVSKQIDEAAELK